MYWFPSNACNSTYYLVFVELSPLLRVCSVCLQQIPPVGGHTCEGTGLPRKPWCHPIWLSAHIDLRKHVLSLPSPVVPVPRFPQTRRFSPHARLPLTPPTLPPPPDSCRATIPNARLFAWKWFLWEHKAARKVDFVLLLLVENVCPRKLLLHAHPGAWRVCSRQKLIAVGVIFFLLLSNGEKQAHPPRHTTPRNRSGHPTKAWEPGVAPRVWRLPYHRARKRPNYVRTVFHMKLWTPTTRMYICAFHTATCSHRRQFQLVVRVFRRCHSSVAWISRACVAGEHVLVWVGVDARRGLAEVPPRNFSWRLLVARNVLANCLLQIARFSSASFKKKLNVSIQNCTFNFCSHKESGFCCWLTPTCACCLRRQHGRAVQRRQAALSEPRAGVQRQEGVHRRELEFVGPPAAVRPLRPEADQQALQLERVRVFPDPRR